MLIIPANKISSQTIHVVLAGQSCEIFIYTKATGTYLDISILGVPIINGALCLDRTKIVRYPGLGFIGDLAFVDTQGTSDPYYTGFGDRFLLAYLEASDLAKA